MSSLSCAYRHRPVFLTGHTGFKGAWLSLWLARLGAKVTGYALPPSTRPNLFQLARVEETLASQTYGDCRDLSQLTKALRAAEPEIVFHLAAQPLVRMSYREPVETWSANVMGTVHLLEAVRHCPSVKAVVVVTTDKCYENKEWFWGYRETDPLGGHDPYSASKAGAELVVASYRQSFFAAGGPLLATARAGNVIGGGDWSEDRLIPDAARAAAAGRPMLVRNPSATRPWQHVVDPLRGYLMLGQRLLSGELEFADAFNFGPEAADNLSVAEVLACLQIHWPELTWHVDEQAVATAPHEARFLYLDSSKARRLLSWAPKWDIETALAHTAAFYRSVQAEPGNARHITEEQMEALSA